MIAMWIIAGCCIIATICVIICAAIRLSDEMRFRRQLNGIDEQHRSDGAIVIERQLKSGKRRQKPRKERAQMFIDARIGGDQY